MSQEDKAMMELRYYEQQIQAEKEHSQKVLAEEEEEARNFVNTDPTIVMDLQARVEKEVEEHVQVGFFFLNKVIYSVICGQNCKLFPLFE